MFFFNNFTFTKNHIILRIGKFAKWTLRFGPRWFLFTLRNQKRVLLLLASRLSETPRRWNLPRRSHRPNFVPRNSNQLLKNTRNYHLFQTIPEIMNSEEAQTYFEGHRRVYQILQTRFNQVRLENLLQNVEPTPRGMTKLVVKLLDEFSDFAAEVYTHY